jgi:DNA-binding response OmpR family regulator
MPVHAAAPATIVLVEDDQDIARLICFHLEKAAFSVRWRTNAQNVVAEAEKDPPALFLLDLMLPGIDGFQLCRMLKQHGVLKTRPIIVLTAKTGQSDRKLAFQNGADDYLTKPFSPADLVSRVRRLAKIAAH